MKHSFVLLLLLVASTVSAGEVPIRDFFRDANYTSVSLSPDGKHMAVIIPKEDRSLLTVLGVADSKIVGKWDYGLNRYFREVIWANDHRLLFRVGFKTGALDYDVGRADMYASNIDGTGRLDIPNGNFYNVVDTLPDDPDYILVARSVENAFLSKLNVNTGRITTVASGPMDSGSFVVDHAGNVRYGVGMMNDGRNVTYRRDGDRWSLVHDSPRAGDTFVPIAFDADNTHAYLYAGVGGKPESIQLLEPASGKQTTLSENGTVAPSDLLWSSDRKTLLGVGYEDGIPYWDFVAKDNPETLAYAGLVKAFPGKAVRFGGSSRDGRYVLVSVYSDRDPGQVYLFDHDSKSVKFLLASRSWIKPEDMAVAKPVDIRTRDGLMVHGYLTIPSGSNGKNLPLIVNPHGGPHGIRDDWGFNPEAQLFANRGYAVLQVNYRGSGGYGAAFESAGYRKWGTAMQDDLTDSVRWAVAQGIADPGRVCIYGGSYGGYAALMSAVREPDLYKCAVGYAGVYDLDIQRRNSDTSEVESGRSYMNDVLPSSVGERHAQSPIYGVDRITAAVMLVHGAKDVRVPIKNMYELIDRMEAVGKKPEAVVVEKKEAHGFRDLDNNVNLYTKMLAFFDSHIGNKQATAQTP